MPMIRVEMLPGRTPDQKRALAKEITDSFVRTCGGKPESVQIVIAEVAPDHWATAGVMLADRPKT